MKHTINIDTTIAAPASLVWQYFTAPQHITQWNFATPDWQCPSAENDLKPGGKYKARMEAKDGSFGFDFEAVYDEVVTHKKLAYTITDGRKVVTQLEPVADSTRISTTFEAEDQHSPELQRAGWQAILDNFKNYAEAQQ